MNRIINDKFCISVTTGRYDAEEWPGYFSNFSSYCAKIAEKNGWDIKTVINYELKPLGGRLIVTSTQGMYLRWDQESSHTAFVLKWS